MEFRKREWQYPNSDKWDGILDSLCIEYNMDIHYKDSVATETHVLFENSSEQEQTENQKEEFVTLQEISDDIPHFNPSADGVQIGFKYCRNCGNKLPVDSKFCDKCGKKIDY